jgi:hypothetical protein
MKKITNSNQSELSVSTTQKETIIPPKPITSWSSLFEPKVEKEIETKKPKVKNSKETKKPKQMKKEKQIEQVVKQETVKQEIEINKNDNKGTGILSKILPN